MLAGHAGSINFGKIAGEKTRFSANYGYKSPGFDINDLGFQRRADERYVSHWFQMRDNVPGRFTRSFIWNLNQYAGWNFDGDRLWSGGNVNMHWTWKNYYDQRLRRELQRRAVPRSRHPRRARRCSATPTSARWYYFGTDSRKSLSADYNGYLESDGKGTTRHNIGPYVTWRPTTATSISTGFRYNINNDDAQWVDERGRRTAADALRVRPAEAAHGRRSRSASTTR